MSCTQHMLCVPEMFFSLSGCCGRCMLHVCGGFTSCTPFRNERGAVLLILGDASYCFVDDCAVGLVMHSGEPEQSHSVMHLLVQRQGITLNCEVVSLLNSAAGLEYSNRRVTLRLSCVLLRNKVEVLLCARKMRIQEELWNE